MNAEQITESTLREFLDRIPEFEKNLSRYSQDGNTDLLTKLEQVLQNAVNGIPAEPE